jgi:hypothetical protein
MSGFLNSSSTTNNISMFDKMENDAVADSTTDTAVLDSIMKTGLASVNNGRGYTWKPTPRRVRCS